MRYSYTWEKAQYVGKAPPLPLLLATPLSSTPSAAPLPPLPPPTGLISNTGFSRAEAEGKTDEELKAAVPSRAHTAESRQASGATRTGQPQRCGNCGCIHGGKSATCTAPKNLAYHSMTKSKRRKLLPNHTW